MHHSLMSALPFLIAPLASGFVIWSGLCVRAVQRAHGRRAIEAELSRLGETALRIDHVPLHTLVDKAGLSGAHVFRVAARAPDGSAKEHLWAYEPGLIKATRPDRLKRLAHGIWIPA